MASIQRVGSRSAPRILRLLWPALFALLIGLVLRGTAHGGEATAPANETSEAGADAAPSAPASAPAPSPVDVFHLHEAVARALRTHPEVQASRAGVREQEYRRRETLSGYLPQANLDLSYGRERSDTQSLRNSGIHQPILNRKEASLSLSQLLFDGFRTRNLVHEQYHLREAARSSMRDVGQSVVLRAVQAYLDVLRQAEQVALARADIAEKEDLLAKVRQRLRKGIGKRSEESQVLSRVARARINLSGHEGELANAEAAFLEAVGCMPADLIIPPVPAERIPVDLESAQSEAHRTHPSLRSLRANLEAARSSLHYTHSDFLPTVELELSGSRNLDIDGSKGLNADAIAALSLNWDFLEGGRKFASRGKAKAALMQSEMNLQAEQRVIDQALAEAWVALRTAHDRLKYLRETIASDQQVVSAFYKEHALGKRTLIDLLDSADSLYNSKAQAVDARYTVHFGVYNVFYRMGNLSRVIVEVGERCEDVREEIHKPFPETEGQSSRRAPESSTGFAFEAEPDESLVAAVPPMPAATPREPMEPMEGMESAGSTMAMDATASASPASPTSPASPASRASLTPPAIPRAPIDHAEVGSAPAPREAAPGYAVREGERSTPKDDPEPSRIETEVETPKDFAGLVALLAGPEAVAEPEAAAEPETARVEGAGSPAPTATRASEGATSPKDPSAMAKRGEPTPELSAEAPKPTATHPEAKPRPAKRMAMRGSIWLPQGTPAEASAPRKAKGMAAQASEAGTATPGASFWTRPAEVAPPDGGKTKRAATPDLASFEEIAQVMRAENPVPTAQVEEAAQAEAARRVERATRTGAWDGSDPVAEVGAIPRTAPDHDTTSDLDSYAALAAVMEDAGASTEGGASQGGRASEEAMDLPSPLAATGAEAGPMPMAPAAGEDAQAASTDVRLVAEMPLFETPPTPSPSERKPTERDATEGDSAVRIEAERSATMDPARSAPEEALPLPTDFLLEEVPATPEEPVGAEWTDTIPDDPSWTHAAGEAEIMMETRVFPAHDAARPSTARPKAPGFDGLTGGRTPGGAGGLGGEGRGEALDRRPRSILAGEGDAAAGLGSPWTDGASITTKNAAGEAAVVALPPNLDDLETD